MTAVANRYLTTLDFFKCAALLCMILDHVGAYIFPDQMWWHVFGRWFGATWYVLIGYSRSRDLSSPIWLAGMMLVLMNMVVGMAVFPLNSLFTIIVIRLVLDRVAKFAFQSWENFFMTIFVMTLSFLPISYLLENSTVCLLGGLLGYAVRHLRDNDRPDMPLFKDPHFMKVLLGLSMVFGTAFQVFAFPFSGLQLLVMMPGFMIGLYLFTRVPMTDYPALTARLPRAAVQAIQFGGRHTMELYVAHLALFKVIALCLALLGSSAHVGYSLFDWEWVAHGAGGQE